MALIEFNQRGIYCPPADVYIDPWKPVKRALITHGHADHSRPGHQHYLCTDLAKPVIKYRLGSHVKIESVPFGAPKTINGVRFSFHPAGHIIGSAQIRVEYKGEIWVISGDYKTEDDGLCKAFEPVQCHHFISECTFGLPVYTWKEQSEIAGEINQWWLQNQEEGKVTFLAGYSLGKAQRLLHILDPSIGPIFTHGAVENVNTVIRNQGIQLPETKRVVTGMKRDQFEGALVMGPPSAMNSTWLRQFKTVSVGIASGWMALRGARRRRGADRGFILSDHADWKGLNEAVAATGAENIYVTHGYTNSFGKWLSEQGYNVMEIPTEYEGELNEMEEGNE